jgi:elongation factor Ts
MKMITASMVKELRELTGAGMLDCKKALEEANGNIEEASTWLREKGIAKAAKKESRIAAEGLVSILTKGNKAVIVEVNSETDFVAKNDEFKDLINTILNLLIESNVSSVEEALALTTSDGTLSDTITNKIAKIGEKISFRRFELVTKSDNEVFGTYIHMGGKIGVLVVLEGSNEEVAKDVAMHAAAMRPKYLDIESVPTEDLDKEREIQKQVAINEGKPDNIAEKMVEGRIKKYYKEVCLTEQPFVKNDDMSVSEFVKLNGGKIISMVRYEVGEGMQKREENFAEEVAKQING